MATVNGLTREEAQQVNRKLATPGAELNKVEFRHVINNFKSEIEAALPVHLKKNADKYARQAMTLFNQNPKLQKCTGITILSALMTATGLGLDLTPQLGQCYIIPYENRKKDGNNWITVNEATFQLGYRGAIALAQRSGELTRIAAEVVCEKDHFEYSKGLNPVLEHRESEEEDRGAIRFVYAVANFRNGGYAFEVWPVSKVVAHAKKFSKSYYKRDYKTGKMVENPNSPWHTDFESMAKKTLIMAIWKYLPLSTEIMLAQDNDESIKRELGEIQSEKEIITVSASPVERDDAGEPELEFETPEPQGGGVIDPEIVEPGAGPAFPGPEPEDGAKAKEGGKEAPKAATPLELAREEVLELLGPAGLDLTDTERAQYLFDRTTKRDLKDIPLAGLSKVAADARAELARRDGEGL